MVRLQPEMNITSKSCNQSYDCTNYKKNHNSNYYDDMYTLNWLQNMTETLK